MTQSLQLIVIIVAFLAISLHSIRSEHAAEWPSQAAHEGSVCGAMFDSASASELLAALLTHADGSACVCLEWLSDFSQPGASYPGAVRG